MTVKLLRSVCPYDCPDTCGLLVEVVDGQACSVQGDPEHPYSRGTLCAKMNAYPRTVHSSRRLTTPLLRRGAKGSGEFVAIDWAEALGRVADGFRQAIDRHGAESILPYSYAGTMGLVQRNAGHPFFHALGASLLDRTICAPAKGLGWAAVMGGSHPPPPESVQQSDLVLLWGINAAATSIHYLQDVKIARQRGAKVWLIETYQTPTAAAADHIVLVRPGSDGALALGLMHLLLQEDLLDHDFLQREVQGFAELRDQVLPAYPPQRVSELTGVSEAVLRQLAQAYGRARAPMIRLGSGLSRYGNGAMTVRTITALPALVGAYGRPGGGCFCATSTGGAFELQTVVREDFLAGRTPRSINMNCLGDALTAPVGTPVSALYVYHSNPAAVAPDQNRVLAGLAREDLFSVVHERFLTDTARYADLVLPATSSLEHSDLYRAFGSYCIQRAEAVIPPVGESKSNWEVFSLLAEEIGLQQPFFRQSADDLIDGLLAAPSPWRQGIDLAALAQGKGVELRVPQGCLTPSGKIELLNPRQPQPLPDFVPPHGGDEPLRLMTAPSLYALNASFYERDELRAAQEGMLLQLSPAEAAARGLRDGEAVLASNALGEVLFKLRINPGVPDGVAVAEGVWWLEFAPGARGVNALTSQRLTDQGGGSTFYDNTVEVRRAP